ncbi:MAG: UxaA family hydrolase [Thermoplasmata archaeon]
MIKALVHFEKDFIGIATDDLKKGEEIEAVFMDTNKKVILKTLENIPLGHKIALTDMKKGVNVIEYGEIIGQATKDIKKGEHVHVHNIKSLRW